MYFYIIFIGMKGFNKLSLEVAVAKMEVLAMNATQNLQAMQEELAMLKQGLAEQSTTTLAVTGVENEAGPSSPKDRSKWFLDGSWYNKSNFPLAVFRRYVDRQLTLATLEQLFSVENVYPEPILGNKKVFKRAEDVAVNEERRYCTDTLITENGQAIVVTNQLGMNNFPQLVAYLAKCFGFPLKGKDLNRDLWPALEGAEITYLAD